MIKDKTGETFEYEGRIFRVGDWVYANEGSDYEGLFGHIKEIRTGEDKDTENETADIYCEFMPPIIPAFIEKIEERFSKLYGEPKKLEDLALDEVIMAPEMLLLDQEILSSDGPCKETVFVVTKDWAYHGDSDSDFELFYTLKDAQVYFLRCLAEEVMEGGPLFDCRGDEDVCEDSSETFYEIYQDGDYNEDHYTITIKEKEIHGERRA